MNEREIKEKAKKDPFFEPKCKICRHVYRQKIEDMIYDPEYNYTDIARKFEDLNRQNVGLHYRAHMKPRDQATLEEQEKYRVNVRLDSLTELRKLMIFQENVMKESHQRYKNLDPEDKIAHRYIAALASQINARRTLISLHAKLSGDVEEKKTSGDIASVLMAAQKEIKRVKKLYGDKLPDLDDEEDEEVLVVAQDSESKGEE